MQNTPSVLFVCVIFVVGAFGEHHDSRASSTVSLDEVAAPGSLKGANQSHQAQTSDQLQAVSGVLVKANIYVGYTSENRFDEDMQGAFMAALAASCQVEVGDIKITLPKSSAPSRAAAEMTSDDKVLVDTVIQVKNRISARIVSGSVKQGVVGGQDSNIAKAFKAECLKIGTIDNKFTPIVTLKQDPIVVGGEPETVVPPETAVRPKWCKHYGETGDEKDGSRAKWTEEQCAHDWGTYEEILSNIEGVICVCNGLKISILPRDPKAPDLQTVALVRAAASSNNKTYRTYAMKIQSGVSSTRTTPEIGLTVQMAFEQTGKKNPRRTFLSLNGIVEYMPAQGTYLQESTTKHLDYTPTPPVVETGVQCNSSVLAQDQPPTSGKDCEVQSFYLDKFHPAVLVQDGKLQSIQFTSDIQHLGGPWCMKENGGTGCQAAQKKPVATFTFGFNQDDFMNTQLGIEVDNFPYKSANTSLAMQGKIYYAHEVATAIDAKDRDFEPESRPAVVADGKCSLGANSVLPADCPHLTMDGGFQMSWPRVVTNVHAGTHQRVSASKPESTSKSSSTILPANNLDSPSTSDSDSASDSTSATDVVLKAESVFFSFKHHKATGLKWDPSITATNLPQIPHNLSIFTSPSVWHLLGLLTLVVLQLVN